MHTDAMNAGVNPGGLQSRTEIRVLICYILNNISAPVPLDLVIEQLHFEGIANFFELSFAIAELKENNNINAETKNNATYYTITNSGKLIADELSPSLPTTVKEYSIDIAERICKRATNEERHKVSIDKNGSFIHVTCSVMENDLELASVKLLVPDDETALKVKENFLNDPVKTLLNITSALTDMKL